MSHLNIPDQRLVWNDKHSMGEHEKLRHSPSPLSALVGDYFPESSDILELGCGVGRDAVVFQDAGHNVIATDSSGVAIEQNKKESSGNGVVFNVLDMQEPLPYEDQEYFKPGTKQKWIIK